MKSFLSNIKTKKLFFLYEHHRQFLVVGLSGLLMGVSIVVPYAGWLIFLGIFVFIKKLFEAKPLWRMMGIGWLAWFVKALIVVSFFLSTYPITSFPIDSIWYQVGLILLSWVSVALALSLGGVVFGLFVYIGQKYQIQKFWLIILLPLFWLSSELIGSLAYSILTLGTGSSIQLHFSMGYVGYALATIPGYIGWGAVAGVYGLTIFTVLLVMSWYIAVNNYHKKLLIGLILLLGVVGLGISNNILIPTNTLRVFTIDTFFPANSMIDEAAQKSRAIVLNEAIKEAQKYEPDYIILPEDSRYLDLVYGSENKRQAYALYQFLNASSSALVIDSARIKTEDGGSSAVLRSFIFSSTKTPIMSDKRYLTPQGEYIPYYIKQLVRILGNEDILSNSALPVYVEGMLTTPTYYDGPLVLFCYESLGPTTVRSLIRKGDTKPPFVAHLVSQAWFHNTFLVTHQLDTMLRIQAIWNKVPIISAGNGAVGKTYLPDGKVIINTKVARGNGWVVRESSNN